MTNHTINNRSLTCINPLQDELDFNPHQNYLFELSYLGGLSVCGDKAAEFLQGQLSCNILDVNSKQMRPGAQCNLQGRILALMDVVDWQGLHLILPKDQLDATQLSLAKTALFSRVTLQSNLSLQVFGLYLQNESDMIPDHIDLPAEKDSVTATDWYCCYQIANQRYLILVNSEHVEAFKKSINANQYRGSLAWHMLKLRAGLIDIYPNSRGLFLPHRLGLQKTSCISFNKGCYKGQEIIARTHYRATLKHDMKLVSLHSSISPYAGQRIIDATTQAELGEIIDYCPIADETYLLAISSIFEHGDQIQLEGIEQDYRLNRM